MASAVKCSHLRRLRLALVAVTAAVTFPLQAETYHFVTLDYAPLQFQASSGKATGALVDIVREIMTNLGHEVEIKVMPWARSIELVKTGRADAIFTAYRNAERETFLDYSREILIPQVMSLFVKKNGGKAYTGQLTSLTGARVGTVSTISYGELFDQARANQQVKTERVENLDLNFKKLLAGRLDYVISNRYSADAAIERLNLSSDVMELEPAVEIIPSFIGFSKKNQLSGLRDRFDEGLRKLRASGRYQAVLAAYRVHAPVAK